MLLAAIAAFTSFVVQTPPTAADDCARIVDEMRPLVKEQTGAENILGGCIEGHPVFSVDVDAQRALPGFFRGEDGPKEIETFASVLVTKEVTTFATDGSRLISVKREIHPQITERLMHSVYFAEEAACYETVSGMSDSSSRRLVSYIWDISTAETGHAYYKTCAKSSDGWGLFVVDLTARNFEGQTSLIRP